MPVITFDVGGADLTLPCTRAGKAAKRRVGEKSYAYIGDERTHIRAELMVIPLALVNATPSDCAAVEAMFAKRAQVPCAGDVFNNGGATVVCSGDYTDDMEQGGDRRIPGITLYEVSNPGGIGGGGGGSSGGGGTGGGIGGIPAGVSPDDTLPPAGPNFHYDAQALVGFSDEDPLDTVWEDADNPGVAHDAVCQNPPFPGFYDVGVMNGHPGIRITELGNNQRGYGGGGLGSWDPLEGEAFLVIRANTGGPFWDFGPVSIQPSLPNTSGGTMIDHFGSTIARSFVIGSDPTEPFLYHVRAKAGEWSCWVNGVLKLTSSINTVSWGNRRFGASGGSFVFAMNGWIGELIVRSSWYSLTDAAALEASLMSKWGI